MKNTYTARFYDYYGWEMTGKTKSFNTFRESKNYLIDICNNDAIPFAQLDKNGNAIDLNGHSIGANTDSRK